MRALVVSENFETRTGTGTLRCKKRHALKKKKKLELGGPQKHKMHKVPPFHNEIEEVSHCCLRLR